MTAITIGELAVLLVEPSSTQRKIIGRALADAGITKLEEAPDCASALVSLQAYQPDLVISSMYLPDGTGTKLVEAMRLDDSLSSIAFMLISSEQKWESLDPVRQAGVVAILPKPFGGEELRRALLTTLDFVESDEMELQHYDVEDLRVLLVDDSAMARKHLGRVLEGLGIQQITVAKNGSEAVQMLDEQGPFDLVVTDYNMPEMDGEQLTSHIRKHPEYLHLPILLVTSEADETRLSSVRQSGVSAICDKPFEPANVRDLLRRILDD